MIKVALLSRWHVHADDYARDIQANDDVFIELIWDEEVKRGKEWAKELGVSFEQDLQSVLSNSDIDAVIVNTPTNMHKEVIIAAAKHKKHIFTEKILSFSVVECEEIYQAVEDAGVELMVSLPRLTENHFLYAEKAIQEGWIGKLTMIRCRLAHNGAVVSKGNTTGWLPERFFNKEQTGGGAMIDLGAHPIYLLNRLAGKAQAVYARFRSVTNLGVDDNSVVLVDYDENVVGIIETSFVSNGSPFQLELYGTEGTVLISGHEIRVNSPHVNNGELTVLEKELPALPMPMVQWISTIQTGSTPTITKEDVINLTLINEAAIKSYEEERRVELKEILG